MLFPSYSPSTSVPTVCPPGNGRTKAGSKPDPSCCETTVLFTENSGNGAHVHLFYLETQVCASLAHKEFTKLA